MTWVWANSPYSGERLLLHLALADFANDEGICFPSHGTLARKARCSKGWVSQTVRQMIADGLLVEVEKAGQGRGKVGRYRLLIGDTQCDLSASIGDTPTAVRSHSDASASYLLNRQEPSDISQQFDRLWAAYPRKTAKGAARRSFERLMRSSDAPSLDVLLAAVARYSATVSDMKFCAHLATWLNGERWLDEQTLPAAVTVEKSGSERSAESLAAAFVHTARSESDLVECLASYPPAAQSAALTLYRQMRASNA